jgi:predicted permease
MENFILIFLCLSAGLGMQHLKIFNKEAPLTLNLYVIWIALPALILYQVPTLSFSSDLLVLLVMPWLMALLSVILILSASHALNWSREVCAVLLLTIPLGNTSFLGIPMIEAFWGADMVSYGIIYDQFGSFMILSSYGSFVLALYSGQKRKSVKELFIKIFTFPPFIALLTALIFKDLLQHPAMAKSLSLIAASLVPVVMFSIGLQLNVRLPHGQSLPFWFGMGLKLLIAPFAALLLCQVAGIDSNASRIAIFEAGMPPMVTAGAMAMSAGLAPRLAAALVGGGIIVSFATLSLLAFIL